MRLWMVFFLAVAGCATEGDERSVPSAVAADQSEAPASTAPTSTTVETPAVVEVTYSSDKWEVLPEGLSPRSNALGVWTGSEVLVIGGDEMPWCPDGADCIPPEVDQLSDGAAFNPNTNEWRPIAEAPSPIGPWSSTAIVEGQLFVHALSTFTLSGRSPTSFLAYDIVADDWTVHDLPGRPDDVYQLVAAGDRLVAYPASDESGEKTDRVFDPATGTWSDLPPDPLSPSFDRFIASGEGALLLFARNLVANPGSEGPSLARIAVYHWESASWEVVGEADVLGTESGHQLGAVVAFPWPGEADGGQVNNWGRSYPHGGIYNPETRSWRDLPEPARTDSFEIAGVRANQQTVFVSTSGSMLDLEHDDWLELPPLPDTDLDISGRTLVPMGPHLFVFGGEYWDEGTGTPTAAAYALTPGR